MKKLVTFVALMVAVGSLQAGEMTRLKAQYMSALASTNPAVLKQCIASYGGTTNVETCLIASNWDSKQCVEAINNQTSKDPIPAPIYQFIGECAPPEDCLALVCSLARRNGKTEAVRWLSRLPPTLWADTAVTNMFELPDLPGETYKVSLSLDDFWRKTVITQKSMTIISEMKPCDYVRFLLNGGPGKPTYDVANAKRYLIAVLEKKAKRSLRAAGKTFVTRNGINPVEVLMKPAIDAMNAPKLEGIEAAIEALGVNVPKNVRDNSVWADIAVRMNGIMQGDLPADSRSDGAIIILLGPDGYNAWVKEFNEGK
jgi:hypothetical protein